MYHDWTFFKALVDNVQLDLAKADMGIAALYASLVLDESVRETIFNRITGEHALATGRNCKSSVRRNCWARCPSCSARLSGATLMLIR